MTAPARPALAEAVRLTPSFNPDRLVAELADVAAHRWEHQRIHAPDGGIGAAAAIDWRVLPLRSPGGDAERTDPGGPGPADFAPTRWLDQLPYLRGILDTIPAPLNAVRLMALGPGAASQPHSDPKYALHRGLVRLHIPIVTHPDAVLILDGVEHRWQPGQFWYGDFSREHLVRNTGPVTRVHTVIDALLTRELAGWFPAHWQTVLTEGDVLLNRATPALATDPVAVPYPLLLPLGFTDFTLDQPLDGPDRPAQVLEVDGQLTLAAGGRAFALVPVGPGEYRFTGWSEQRTIQFVDDGIALHTRHGHTTQQRYLPHVHA
jgi:aspartate beta-hydroxylase